MDRYKFKDMLEKQALYLCRADKLQDKFEGTYSRAQLLDSNCWLSSKGYDNLIDSEAKSRKINRKCFYINSWCRAKHDYDLMWKAYTTDAFGVAIQSRIYRLEAICDSAWKDIGNGFLDVSLVEYFEHTEGGFINYGGDDFGAVIHKDCHFKLDNEIRIICTQHIKPQPESIPLPVNLSDLIERLVLSPGATDKDAKTIRQLLNDCGLRNVPVELSQNNRDRYH